MDTYQIEIIEPRAKRLLDDLADMNLITVRPMAAKKNFKSILEKLRNSATDIPTIDEITDEVESVRANRYSKN